MIHLQTDKMTQKEDDGFYDLKAWRLERTFNQLNFQWKQMAELFLILNIIFKLNI